VTVGVAAAQASPDKPEIRTSAAATRGVRANGAVLTLQFTAEDSTPALAGRRLALRADSVRQVLVALGIRRDSLVTASRWSWGADRIQTFARPRCVAPPPAGHPCQQAIDSTLVNGRLYATRPLYDTLYRARETIEVRTGDPTLVGAVIDSALALRITDISNIRFIASDLREAQTSALQEAAARAREQAEAIAAANGGRLGRVISLSTSNEEGGYSRSLLSVSSSISAEGGATQVTAPVVPVTVTVYGRWQFVPR
jgi:uncharacterized protein YggE